ncbi:hypothetical protein BOX15_Mlig001175g1 [Macrostomum lignano]|uniref:Uncharacterized protein n=1 Tax=Macrostomum lignano TaxID=282301 RepID=A0A267GXQ9_9PLAT|nr:hypothetical protein BOX15_Mlig001175g1 [Macrostomum lignano]
MACEVAQLSGNAGAPNNSNNFSPLTLFECTITNAQMLIESMADRELLHALRIASGLHTHIVGVIEPRCERAFARSEAHGACLLSGAAAAATTSSAASSPLPSSVAAAGTVSQATANGASTRPKTEFDAAQSAGGRSISLFGSGSVKEEQLLIEDEDSIDDCLIMEEDGSLAGSAAAFAPPPGVAAASAAVAASPSRKRTRQETAAAGTSQELSVAGAAALPVTGVNSECRSALRNSYRELKGNGPHLFNFSMPFTDSVNQRVAEQVMSHAQRQLPLPGIPQDVWWNELYLFAQDLSSSALKMREKFAAEKRRQRNRQRKLARRQKSFELLASSLSTDQFDKYRVLLSRDYTSSDEDATAADLSSDELGGAGGSGALRVRSLAWESAEMAGMKRQLDEAFLETCANQKQSQQLRRTIRDSSSVSGRPPPTDCPDWALAEDFKTNI